VAEAADSGRPLGGVDLHAGFPGLIGLQLDEMSPERVTAHVDVGSQHLQPLGLVHGGLYASIAETLASIGAALSAAALRPGHSVVGLENHTSFLRAGRAGDRIEALALARHPGRRVQHWTVTMRRARDGRELAASTVRLLLVHPEDV
jgi:1,4-dihydroxy-2-naphthoyl-CoA hydrolase